MAKIFLSYRRSDSQDVTGRIYDRLIERFSAEAVFRDVDSIPLGTAFASVLKDALARTDVALIVIGPAWLTAADAEGKRRLDDPSDYLRIEVELALSVCNRVIPLLVTNARMPDTDKAPESIRPLFALQAQQVRPDPDFHTDMDRLIGHLERELGIEERQPSEEQRRRKDLEQFLAQVSRNRLPTADSARYARRISANPRDLREIAEEMAAEGAERYEALLPIFQRYKHLLPERERPAFEGIAQRVRRLVREQTIASTQPNTAVAGSSLSGASLRVEFQQRLSQSIAWELARMDGEEPKVYEYVNFLIELEQLSGLKDERKARPD